MATYENITYPFFGRKPPKVLNRQDGKVYADGKLLDWDKLGDTYAERSIRLCNELNICWRFKHCTSLDSIVFNKVRFGIDNTGKIHDFRGFRTKVYTRRVKRIVGKKVYVEGVPNPILLPIQTSTRIRDAMVKIVFINEKWRIREFFTRGINE